MNEFNVFSIVFGIALAVSGCIGGITCGISERKLTGRSRADATFRRLRFQVWFSTAIVCFVSSGLVLKMWKVELRDSNWEPLLYPIAIVCIITVTFELFWYRFWLRRL
jgi:hypothetical protein